MDELGIPQRLFEAGFEPTGRKRVNNYFNLRWIDLIKNALDEEDLEMLNDSQFHRVLQMGSHTFSVMFLHYCLSRQLVTAKEYELWWIFVGKPIRYAIQDFAKVTGLNCSDGVGLAGEATEKGIGRGKASGKGKSTVSIWDELFRGEDKPTPGWIMERLVKGKKYKDRLTRLRLSLLVLVEGILCPTCGTTKIRPEVVSMLGNLDAFLKYPWGRESFVLTVKSTKARSAVNYVKDTMAIQGFTHAMVLVTLTACPSIIIKTGGADPLSDSTLPTEEIISQLVSRKVVVNIVSAKSVDELGQAYVRSLISSDEEGEDLYRSMDDRDDTSVDTMVALIEDDYPFEHNTWSGGVKADDVKVKKGNAQTSEESDENVADPVERENMHHAGVDSAGYPGDSRGQSAANPAGHPPSGDRFHFDVRSVINSAADAFEEKMIAMFEGYILSLKGHFEKEVRGLRTDLQSATAAIGDLGSKVTAEFDRINKLLNSRVRADDMEPPYGFSPLRHSSPFRGQPDDVNTAEFNPGRTTTPSANSGGMEPQTEFYSPQRDVRDLRASGSASGGQGPNPDEGSMPAGMDGGLSPPKQPDIVGEQGGREQRGQEPINVQSCPTQNQPAPTSLGGDTSNPPSHVDVAPVDVPSERPIDDPVAGVVNKILSDAGVSQDAHQPGRASSNEHSQTSPPVIPDKVVTDDANEDLSHDVGQKIGEEVDGEDVTVTKVQAGQVNPEAAGLPTDGGRRISKRTHTSTKRYTPPVPTVRKKDLNKKVPRQRDDNAQPPKRQKKVAAQQSKQNPSTEPTKPKPPAKSSIPTQPSEPSNPNPPSDSSQPKPTTEDKATFIGGFSAFDPPTPAAREAFMKNMAEAKSNAPSSLSAISIASLDDVFSCSGVCSYEAMDRVVLWMRKRRDMNLSAKFDFIPPTFFLDLLRCYHAFEATEDKEGFTFPLSLRSQFLHRPQWFSQINFLYTVMLVKERHWVGMIVDLPMWAIYVVDANQSCPSTSVVKDALTPISIMLPHMISRFCLTTRPRELNFLPFPISRLDMPVLLEHPGYSAVVALILLEVSASNKPLINLSLTEEEVRVAAENYAISTLAMFKVVPSNPDF